MSRNHSFSPMEIASLTVHLSWATVEVMVDDVEQIQLLINGDDGAEKDLKVDEQNGALVIEQSSLTMGVGLTAGRWMDVFIRMPRAWKGPVEISTRSGRINARGLCGTDLRLETISGDVRVMNVRGIDCTMHTIAGHMFAALVDCEKMNLRSVSTDITVEDSAFRAVKAASVSGSVRLNATCPVESVEATTASGHLTLQAPISEVKLQFHSVTGQLRTRGVALQQTGVPISLSTVSGDLEVNSTL